jgi:hypothetical protein
MYRCFGRKVSIMLRWPKLRVQEAFGLGKSDTDILVR